MLVSELKSLGLTDNEANIYLALLKAGVLNPTRLAEKTGLHRSYIYDALEKLLEKGIVNTVLVDAKKQYQANNPKVLKEQLEIKLKQVESLIPKLNQVHKISKEETKVELHRGKRVYRTLIKDLTANMKKGEILHLIGIDEELLEQVEPIYLKQYFTIIKQKGVKEKIIIASGKKKLNEKSLEYKQLDKKYLGQTATVIGKKKIYLFVKGQPHNLVVIENEQVAKTYKNNFNLLWSIAK